MTIKAETWYKAKEGTPGGFLYVYAVQDDGRVAFGVAEHADKAELTGGAFVADAAKFEAIIEDADR